MHDRRVARLRDQPTSLRTEKLLIFWTLDVIGDHKVVKLAERKTLSIACRTDNNNAGLFTESLNPDAMSHCTKS